MITINSDKGLIQVDSWDDIISRPGFIGNLNPKDQKLKGIIGRYLFKDKIGCGLSDCHAPHNKGYIVVTESGAETNIGKDCGATYFGVDFETQSRQFERDHEAFVNRETLTSFTFRIEGLEERIHTLRHEPRGAAWVYRNITRLITPGKGCPNAIVSRVCEMARARLNQVMIERVATDSEVEAMEAAQNRTLSRPQYVSEPIAEIAGFSALYPEYNLRELLTIKLEDNIESFRSKGIESMTPHELRHWSQWTGSVEEIFNRAIEATSAGRRLLVSENLLPFVRLVSGSSEIADFRSYLKDLGRHQ